MVYLNSKKCPLVLKKLEFYEYVGAVAIDAPIRRFRAVFS